MFEGFPPNPIFRLRGGIGNQLFIYSAGRILSRQMKATPIFDIRGISHGDCIKTIALPARYLSNFGEKVLKAERKTGLRFSLRHEVNYLMNDSATKLPRNSVVSGYFQDSTYPLMLKNEGTFSEFVKSTKSKEFHEIYSQILSADATLLHLRFGDYGRATETLGNLSKNYYQTAIMSHPSIAKNPIFILSDEPEVARIFVKNFCALDIRIIPRSPTISNFDYLRIFGAAKRLILANSTFSWWGAFLSQNADLVLAPKPWYRNELMQAPIQKTFYPNNFSTLESEWDLREAQL